MKTLLQISQKLLHFFKPQNDGSTLKNSKKCLHLTCIFFLKVRAGSLQDLIYRSGQTGINKATVSITFDNRTGRSPTGFENFEEITVTRQVVVGGKNKYLINGTTVQNKRVQDLFCSVGLNVNNPHFLIMQGRVTKVLNMKPPEVYKCCLSFIIA